VIGPPVFKSTPPLHQNSCTLREPSKPCTDSASAVLWTGAQNRAITQPTIATEPANSAAMMSRRIKAVERAQRRSFLASSRKPVRKSVDLIGW
jgi:hypothetical protein